MSNIGRFQLPPIKGTDVFPSTMQAPPRIRASVEYVVDPREPFNPEVLEDYARNVMAENSAMMINFLQTQRRNYQAGIVDVSKTSRSYPAFDISYSNIQGFHETLNVKIRVPVRRAGGGEEEQDELMLLVLHDGNKLTAISMAELGTGNWTTTYKHACNKSFWGMGWYQVNQLRLGEDYSVIASDIDLTNARIGPTFASLMIATDDPEDSLADSAYVPIVHPMNGSDGQIYLPYRRCNYINGRLESTTTNDYGSAVTAAGAWKQNSNSAAYVNTVSMADGKVDVRTIPLTRSYGAITSSYSGQSYSFSNSVIKDRGCGKHNTVTAIPVPINFSNSERIQTGATFDGIELGGITISQRSYGGTSDPVYIITTEYTLVGFPVGGVHPPLPRGDGATVGPFTSGAGTFSVQSTGSEPVNESYTIDVGYNYSVIPTGLCGVVITYLDLAAGGLFNSSNESVDAAVQDFLAQNEDCGGCTSQVTISSQGPYASSGSGSYSVTDGEIWSAAADEFPYAVDGRLFYGIRGRLFARQYTPYGQSFEGVFSIGFHGFFNLSNGEHLIQGYQITVDSTGEEKRYIMLDGADVAPDLATACGTAPGAINAIFMDIPLSKIVEFD